MDQLLFIGLFIVNLLLVIFFIYRSNKGGSSNDTSGIAERNKEIELLNKSLNEKNEKLSKEQQAIESKNKEIREMESKLSRVKADYDNALNNLELNSKKLQETELLLRKEREEKADGQAKLKAQEERLNHQKKEISEIQKRFNEQFEVLANKILEEKTKKFTEVNKEKLDQILHPLSKNLKEFEEIVRNTYEKEGKERHSLSEEVKKLMKLNQDISQETKDLTEALKGSSKQQGDWGETVLENILEQSGLSKGREYFIQETLRDDAGATLKNEEGKVMRPDVIVQYPDKRKVIIDSKVSLTAYVEFTSADNEEIQNRALKKHLVSITKHIDELSAKSYADYGSDLDFVMMFIPIEGAYIAAMQGNPNLWNEAYKKNVLLISPTNLIAALRLIVDMWERDKQSKNAEKIAIRGGKLYEKFMGFLQSMDDVGSSIRKSQASYDKALSQLSQGRGNLLNQAQDLEKLGIKYNKAKNIPSEIAKNADLDPSLLEENKE